MSATSNGDPEIPSHCCGGIFSSIGLSTGRSPARQRAMTYLDNTRLEGLSVLKREGEHNTHLLQVIYKVVLECIEVHVAL